MLWCWSRTKYSHRRGENRDADRERPHAVAAASWVSLAVSSPTPTRTKTQPGSPSPLLYRPPCWRWLARPKYPALMHKPCADHVAADPGDRQQCAEQICGSTASRQNFNGEGDFQVKQNRQEAASKYRGSRWYSVIGASHQPRASMAEATSAAPLWMTRKTTTRSPSNPATISEAEMAGVPLSGRVSRRRPRRTTLAARDRLSAIVA